MQLQPPGNWANLAWLRHILQNYIGRKLMLSCIFSCAIPKKCQRKFASLQDCMSNDVPGRPVLNIKKKRFLYTGFPKMPEGTPFDHWFLDLYVLNHGFPVAQPLVPCAVLFKRFISFWPLCMSSCMWLQGSPLNTNLQKQCAFVLLPFYPLNRGCLRSWAIQTPQLMRASGFLVHKDGIRTLPDTLHNSKRRTSFLFFASSEVPRRSTTPMFHRHWRG